MLVSACDLHIAPEGCLQWQEAKFCVYYPDLNWFLSFVEFASHLHCLYMAGNWGLDDLIFLIFENYEPS